jgi:class 3 adenylate cyclase
VNLAARMEQTCPPSHIRVTEDFYRLVNHVEDEWKQEETELKNMGVMTTFLLNPLANEVDSR